jgi:hypothetical protein
MAYVEERDFTLRFEVRCEFPESYQGEADGYEWVREFRPLAAELVRTAMSVIAGHPGWRVRPANRGRPSEEEVTLIVERDPEPRATPAS